MENRYVFILIAVLVILDAFAINCSYFVLYFYNTVQYNQVNAVISNGNLLILNLSWLLAALILQLYSFQNVQTLKSICKKSINVFVAQISLLVMFAICFSELDIINQHILFALLCEFLFISFVRFSIYLSESFYFKMDSYKKNIAIIGDEGITQKLEKYFLQHKLSYNLSGTYLQAEIANDSSNGLSELKNTVQFAINNKLDEIYTTLFPENCNEIDEVLELAEQQCVRVKFVTSFMEFRNQESELAFENYKLKDFYDGIPILVSRNEPLANIWNRIIKRTFDIVFSLGVIVFLLSWLMPIMMIIIRLESKGAAIFAQLRSGRNNEPFFCFKFRSMRINAASDTKQAVKGDARITKIGSFMRKTSLDEFPQFFNVLLGNMSIVGPRPHMLKHTEEYREIISHYMVRHHLKPGITGWAQVNGFRGETTEHKQMLDRVEHDVWYLENWSLFKDLEIIYKTVANVVQGEENAY